MPTTTALGAVLAPGSATLPAKETATLPPTEIPITTEAPATPTVVVPRPTLPSIPSLPLDHPLKSQVVELDIIVNKNGEFLSAWTANGVLISSDGLILTTARAVQRTPDFQVRGVEVTVRNPISGQEEVWVAMIAKLDHERDAAILKLMADGNDKLIDSSTPPLPAAVFSNTDQLERDVPMRALGYVRDTLSFMDRAVTIRDQIADSGLYTLNKNLRNGAVGTPIFDLSGQLVGIVTASDYGSEEQQTDCKRTYDTNGDGFNTKDDICPPPYGALNAIRPIKDLRPFIDSALAGDIDTRIGAAGDALDIEIDFSSQDPALFPPWDDFQNPTVQDGR